MPHAVRMLRDNLIDVLNSDYVRMATLKGVSGWVVMSATRFRTRWSPR